MFFAERIDKTFNMAQICQKSIIFGDFNGKEVV